MNVPSTVCVTGSQIAEACTKGASCLAFTAEGSKGARPTVRNPLLRCSGVSDFFHNSLISSGKRSLVIFAALVDIL